MDFSTQKSLSFGLEGWSGRDALSLDFGGLNPSCLEYVPTQLWISACCVIVPGVSAVPALV